MSSEENAESKYEVREVIGKGAFGEVNLVVEKQTKQRYVLKRIKMARQSEWQRKATRQEIEIVSRLRHPFIMPYKEHWTHHGHTINVVYGYCEKGDLTTAIAKQKGKYFPEETLRLWLAELLLAVDYMHRQHVLHRDIKTQNILLTGDGDVQIGDFGLSTVRVPSATEVIALQKQQQSGSDDTDPCIDLSPAHGDIGNGLAPTSGAATPEQARLHHTLATAHVQVNPAGAEAYTNGLANAHLNGLNAHNHAGDKDKDQAASHTPVHDPKAGTRNDYSLVGTPHFMSPELLSNQKYSYETDIWSLGVVMYELTTLKPPFNAFNLAGLVAKIKRASLPPIPPCYSADWTSILKSMLKKDPTRRASPLDLLAVPSMQQALQQARQRAQAITPEYVLPEIPVHDGGISPGFCFDIGAGVGISAVNAEQRTPNAVGPSTPVLLTVPGGGCDDGGGVDAETSPLSKFPDLGATVDSPLPIPAVPAAAGGTAAAAAAPATASVQPAAPTVTDANRSKTPGIVRRSGSSAGAAPGAVTTAAAAPVPRRAMSPQRARVAPAVGGAPRSKTPGRAYGAAVAATKTEQEPSSRIVRKGTLPQTSRSRNALPGMSPRDLSGGGGTGTAAAEAPPQTARAASPTEPSERQSGRRAGPSSGPAPRIAALGSFRAGTAKRSLLDAVTQPAGVPAPAAGAAAAPVAVVVPAGEANDADTEAASPVAVTAADATADVIKIVSPSSAGVKSSPAAATAAGAGAGHAAAVGVGGGRAAPWRATARSVSLTTARTSRAALGVGSSPPQASPSADAGGHAAGVRRPVSVARGGSTDPTTGTAAVAAAATAAHAKRASVPAGDSQQGSGARRPGLAADLGVNSLASARTRAGVSPTHRTIVAPTAVSAATARRRSQPGTLATAPRDAADAGGARQPEKRVRRSSYVSYSKPTESATLQRRPLAAPAPGSTTGVRESTAMAATATAAATAAGGAKAKESGLVSSHPLAASDAALESNSPSASCSPPNNTATAWDAPSANIGASEPNPKGAPSHALQGLPPVGGDMAATSLAAPDAEVDAAALDAEVGTGAAVSRASAAAGSGASHPWRLAPRSRSLLSMTTEDSELSIPDGRYGPAEGNTSAYDGEAAPANTGFAAVPSSAAAVTAPAAFVQPLWSSNQLFSGSYGSCAGSLNDISAQPAAAPSAVAPPAGDLGSGRPSENIGSLAGAASIAADLPRRVSASAFAPHLLYGNVAAASLADVPTADAEGGGTESEASTPADASGADMLSGLQRLTLKDPKGVLDSSRGGGNRIDLVSPGRFDLVSTAAGAVAYSPGGFTSATASPHSARYGPVGGGMEIISPTAVPGPQYSQHGSDLKQHRSGAALETRSTPNGWQGGGAAYYDASPVASNGSTRPNDLAARLDHAGHNDGDEEAEDSSSEVTSQLRPVQEDVDGEAESEQAAQPFVRGHGQGVAHGAGPYGTSELNGTERAQLALLQRVVALAGSLWEYGRDTELGAVLSSTLSRPLMRRPSASGSAASGPAWHAGLEEHKQERHQPRVPELGALVRVTAGPLRGVEAVVRYRGPCHWGAGTVLGLELPRTSAEGDREDVHEPAVPPGCRDGVRYFHCRQEQSGAAFVAADQVVCVE